MRDYTKEALTEALRAINSVIHKCEKAQEKFPQGNSYHTLLRNRLQAMYISKTLIVEELSEKKQKSGRQGVMSGDGNTEQLILNLEKVHTTDLGSERIKKNLKLDVDDVVDWCKQKIEASDSHITRRGKNWYIAAGGCEITVNASGYTIITAHKNRSADKTK